MSYRRLVVHGRAEGLAAAGGVGRIVDALASHLSRTRSDLPRDLDVYLVGCGPPDPGRRRQRARRRLERALGPRLDAALSALRAAAAGPRVHRWPEELATLTRWGGAPLLLHETSNHGALPNLAAIVARPDVRLCTTFVDVQEVILPEGFTREQLEQRRRIRQLYVDRCDAFLAISAFTASTLVERLGVPAERVVVAPLGGLDATPPADPEADAWAAAFGRFVVYPAKPWPHKNHPRLLDAVVAAAPRLRAGGLRLLLTGGMDAGAAEAMAAAIASRGVGDLVTALGFVPDARVWALLRRAEALVFPSLFEGFGLPVLEAMQLGCPVVCSNVTSLPEVAGDAALYVPPTSTEAIAAALEQVAAGRLDRAGMVARGRAQAARFSWDRMIEATLGVYRSLLA